MKTTLKKTLCTLTLLAMVLSLAACSTPDNPGSPSASGDTSADTAFPEKALEIIVGYSAGGANHLAAENLTYESQTFFGVPMTITCMPGAASAVANSYVAAAAADGYTLLNGTLSLPISMYMDTVDFQKEDFIGIACFSEVTPCLVVRADLPVNSLKELVDYCSQNPGSLTWGHSGVGSTLHLAGCNMFAKMGILEQVTEVPFSGTNEAVAQVLGGHLDAVLSFPSSVQEQVRAGNLKVLGVSGESRVEEFPDTPTFVEQGYDAVLTSTRGIFVRSDTPSEIVARLEAGFAQIIQSDDFRERAANLGEPPVYMNSADFTKVYYEQCDLIAELIRDLGLD